MTAESVLPALYALLPAVTRQWATSAQARLIAAAEDCHGELDDLDLELDLALLDLLRRNMIDRGVPARESARGSDPWPAD